MMKKIATYYLIAIAAMNAFFAFVLGEMAGFMKAQVAEELGGKPLPPWTSLALAFPWWPYLVTSVCVGAMLVSLCTRIESRKMNHAVVIILALALWLMFINVVAFVVPWVTLDVRGLN